LLADLPATLDYVTSHARATLLAMTSRRNVLALVGLALVGCLSPTLPLPPPSKPDVEGPDQQGQVTLDGFVPQSDTAVVAINHRTGEIRGQVVANDGHYRFAIGAQIGDLMELWYTIGDEQSPAVKFIIEAPK
jgi:hypothetical protein